VRRLRRELWRQKSWLLHHYNVPSHTSFFTKEFFTKNNMTVVSPNEDKTESRHFDTTKVTEAGVEHPHRTRLPGCI
jgi:hypothetical protein